MVDPSPMIVQPTTVSRTAISFPVGLWLAWVLSIVTAALWVAWPTLRDAAPLDLTHLLLTCALVGVAGLLALTVFEIHLAPWRFLD